MLIRSMSPSVVAVDELGREEDFKAVESVIYSGCKLIATAMERVGGDFFHTFFGCLRKMKVFERYILLGKEQRAGIVLGNL